MSDSQGEAGEWVQLMDDSIVKKILIVGEGEGPEMKETAICSYVARLRDTQQIFLQENAARFTLGEGDTTMGMELALRHMLINEKALVIVEPKFAYGPTGRKSLNQNEVAVPPDTWIEYEVHLHGRVFMPDAPLEEKVVHGQYLKQKGNDHFHRQELREALKTYSAIIKLLGGEDEEEANKLVVDCHNNCAAALAKQEQWNKAKEACVEALTLDPDNLRALNRAADIAMALADWDEAEMAWNRALEVDTDCKTAQQGLARLAKKRADFKKKEREMYGGKLAKSSASSTEKAKRSSISADEKPSALIPPCDGSANNSPPSPVLEAEFASESVTPSSTTQSPETKPCSDSLAPSPDPPSPAEEPDQEPRYKPSRKTDEGIGWKSILQFGFGVGLAFLLAAWDPLGGASQQPKATD